MARIGQMRSLPSILRTFGMVIKLKDTVLNNIMLLCRRRGMTVTHPKECCLFFREHTNRMLFI